MNVNRRQANRYGLRALVAGALAILAAGSTSVAAATLDDVRARGHVLCGVAEDEIGFARRDSSGRWTGLDADFCRAVAAAVLGQADAVEFRAVGEGDRFRALTDRRIDVLSRSTAWTMSRDTAVGIRFAGVLLYDGQGFLVSRAQGLTSVYELSGASICVLGGTSSERALKDFFGAAQMGYRPLVGARWDELIAAYAAGRCSLLAGDTTTLARERSRFRSPGDHIILPELITKEPLGPAVSDRDEQWFAIVRWVLMALIDAEELGLSSQTVDQEKGSPLLEVRRFLGLEADLGQALGLDASWSYNVVKQVGNYGELFERHLGSGSALMLERGLNRLWTRGGLMFGVPIR